MFEPNMGESAPRAASVASAMSATGIDSILALQSVEDPLLARKKAVRRGRSMLDVLDGIKADLLLGHVGEGRLTQLMTLIGQVRQQAEPGLESLLDDIELRARVELAKHGRFPA